MWSSRAFEKFDIYTGQLAFDTAIPQAAQRWLARARAMIKDLSPDDLTEAVELIDWMYNEHFEPVTALERLLKEEENPKEGHPPDHVDENFDVECLLALKENYDLSSYEGKSQLQWSHVFAIAGINRIAEADEDDHFEKNRMRLGEDQKDYSRLDMSTYGLTAALEIIALARMERELEVRLAAIEAGTKEKISLRGKKAAVRKHARSQKLKNQFITWYQQHKHTGKFHSRRQAAEKFYTSLSPEEKILTQSNYSRTLLDALRQFERKNS